MRTDQRSPTALRSVEIVPNYISSAEGSALIRLGETQVICTASVEDGVPAFLKGMGRGWITSEYAMIPRSTETRTPREVSRGRQVGRTMEIQRLIGRSLRAVTDLECLGDRTFGSIATLSGPTAALALPPSRDPLSPWDWRSKSCSR